MVLNLNSNGFNWRCPLTHWHCTALLTMAPKSFTSIAAVQCIPGNAAAYHARTYIATPLQQHWQWLLYRYSQFSFPFPTEFRVVSVALVAIVGLR